MSNREFNEKRMEFVRAVTGAAQDWLSYMGTGSALAAIPSTEPPRYVVAGTLAEIVKLLPGAGEISNLLASTAVEQAEPAIPVSINMNTQFSVTLTEYGANERNWHYAWMRDQFPGVAPAQSSAGDTITEPLWELFKIFGPHMGPGMPEVPFKGNAILIASKVAPVSPEQVEAERERFEAWGVGIDLFTPEALKRGPDGEYVSDNTNSLWFAWHARATQVAPASPEQPNAEPEANEAQKLAPILWGMCEGGGADKDTDIYADGYQADDGDVYVRRAGELLIEQAAEIRELVRYVDMLGNKLAEANDKIAAPIAAAPAAPSELPAILFDGMAVYDEVMANDPHTPRPTADNIADVLDAVVRLMRKEGAAPAAPEQAGARCLTSINTPGFNDLLFKFKQRSAYDVRYGDVVRFVDEHFGVKAVAMKTATNEGERDA